MGHRFLAIAVLCLASAGPASAQQPRWWGPAVADSAMVVSAKSEATRVGLDVLRRGGNAVDAAIAVHFALAVTLPSAGNIGGGGFMVVRQADGAVHTYDYREGRAGPRGPWPAWRWSMSATARCPGAI